MMENLTRQNQFEFMPVHQADSGSEEISVLAYAGKTTVATMTVIIPLIAMATEDRAP